MWWSDPSKPVYQIVPSISNVEALIDAMEMILNGAF